MGRCFRVQIYKKQDGKWVKATHATDILFSIEEAEKPETLNQRVNRLESEVRSLRSRWEEQDARLAKIREEWRKAFPEGKLFGTKKTDNDELAR